MGLFAEIEKEQKVVDNTQTLQSPQVSYVHMVPERTQNLSLDTHRIDESVVARHIDALISHALNESETKRSQKKIQGINRSEWMI